MTEINYKELFGQIVKDQMYANALEIEWHRRRIQARHRSERSGDVEYTPFEEVRDQDHDEMRPPNSGSIQTGDS